MASGVAPARFLHPELHYQPLFRERHRPYCGRCHPLFGQKISCASDLAQYPFILTADDEPDELTHYRLCHSLGFDISGMSDNLEEAKRLALLGIGVCFLPEGFAAPEVAQGQLEPRSQIGRLPDCLEPPMGILGQRLVGRVEEIGIGPLIRPSHPPSQLIELGETE